MQNDFNSNFQDRLVVDKTKLRADCVGYMRLPRSTKRSQFWILFNPKNPKVAFYDADLSRWQLTLGEILDRYRITGRLTRGETDNTKPVDKIISDGEGNYYKITQTYRSEKKQIKT
jgi:hypothetical protein